MYIHISHLWEEGCTKQEEIFKSNQPQWTIIVIAVSVVMVVVIGLWMLMLHGNVVSATITSIHHGDIHCGTGVSDRRRGR